MKSHIIGFLLLIGILALLPLFAAAARCEFYAGSVCAPIYSSGSTIVYIYDNSYTQQAIETAMRAQFGAFGAIERESCGPYLLALLCSQYLPTCTFDASDEPQPRYPCDSFCPAYGLPVGRQNNVTQYNIPEQCSEYNFLFLQNDLVVPPTTASSTADAFLDLAEVDEADYARYFRPICWPTDARTSVATGESLITIESPQPINQFTTSPLYRYRTAGSASSFFDASQSNSILSLSDEERVIIDNFAATCDPTYSDFALKAEVVTSSTREGLAGTSNFYIDLPTHECPSLLAPILVDNYQTDSSPCAIPCPNLTFTHEQYETQDIYVIVFNSLSIVSLFILCVSWTFFPALRLQNYVFYYIICITCMTLSLFVLIPIARAQHITIAQSLCKTPTQEYHMDGYALFQGMVTAFTYMAATAWGLIMVLDIFIQVVIGKHFQKASREYILKERLYHVFAWFWGFYSVVGGLASQQIGATVTVGGSYALIIPSRQQQADGMFNAGDAFFYYPLLVLTIISVILMIAVLIRLLWFKSRAKTTGLRVATFVRLVIFIVANTFIICVFLVYAVFVNSERDNLERTTSLFIQCLHYARTFRPDIDPTEVCGVAPDHNLNFNVLLLTVILFNGMGLIAFLIYGTTTDLFYSWLGWMHVVFGIDRFKKYEKDYRRNRKSTRVGTTKSSHHPATGGNTQSRNSKSGHQSNFLTSQHHQDSHTDRSYLHDPSQPRRDANTNTNESHVRSQSKDPQARSHQSTSQQPSSSRPQSVFNYTNQKTTQQQKSQRRTGGVGLDTNADGIQSTNGEVEMTDIVE